jgi:hypothetical protein
MRTYEDFTDRERKELGDAIVRGYLLSNPPTDSLDLFYAYRDVCAFRERPCIAVSGRNVELVFPGLSTYITYQAEDDFYAACERQLYEEDFDEAEVIVHPSGFCVRDIPPEDAEELARDFFILIRRPGAVDRPLACDTSPFEWLVDQYTIRRWNRRAPRFPDL